MGWLASKKLTKKGHTCTPEATYDHGTIIQTGITCKKIPL